MRDMLLLELGYLAPEAVHALIIITHQPKGSVTQQSAATLESGGSTHL